MGLSTLEVVAQGSPVVFATLFRHFLNRKKTTKDSKARDELLFDEAFTVMKSFLEIATKNTVEDLQRFSNTRIPSPPSILVLPILIPLSTCHLAASHLLRALGGPDQARKIVGGSEWWQVRGVKGVEGEWIVVKKDWEKREKEEREREKEREKIRKRKMKEQHEKEVGGVEGEGGGVGGGGGGGMTEEEIREEYEKEEMDEMRCMLYIHGGAYYWGSINTHRYTIWRYARKMKGRCFAVNYRKAPQYPFPCALQDCLAAYLYLLNPPPEAKHKPIPASQIVIAGDSAGGGLVLALLQLIRDAGLEQPAGAVAISPWGDLTHCFPSVMENFATDVMPPYGFIHKPSTLWPPPPAELSNRVQSTLRDKVREAASRIHSSHPSSSYTSPTTTHDANHLHRVTSRGDTNILNSATDETESSSSAPAFAIPEDSTNETTTKGDDVLGGGGGDTSDAESSSTTKIKTTIDERQASRELHPTTKGDGLGGGEEGKPPATTNEGKVHQNTADPTDGKDMVLEVDGKKVTIRGQIQLYATNAQLPHPYVSPCWGYLGGLCPILVIASDKELLRDEIVYIAHKAAHPDRYPIPDHVRKMMPCLEGIEERYQPTKVHLQIYDEVCHVLPLYSMTTPAKYCFRAIATFAKFVTGPPQPLSSTTSPSNNYTSPPTPITSSPFPSPLPSRASSPAPPPISRTSSPQPTASPRPSSPSSSTQSPKIVSDLPTTLSSQATLDSSSKKGSTDSTSNSKKRAHLSSEDALGGAADRQTTGDVAGPRFGESGEDGPGTAGNPAIYAVGAAGGDPFVEDGMIRERVSTRGVLRPLEPESEIPSLHLPKEELGMIKELPAKRYLTGQGLWDVRYAREAKKVEQHRRKNLERSTKDGQKIIEAWTERVRKHKTEGKEESEGDEKFLMGENKSWKWALLGENPPPSAVVSRRDTNEARKLARIADQSEDDAKSPFGGVNLWTLAVDLLSSSSTSSSRNHSRSTSPNPASDSSTDKTKVSSLRKEEEPRTRKTSSLRLPAFLRRKSALDEKEKEEEKAAVVGEKKIDGLPPSAEAAAAKKSAVEGGGEDATKEEAVVVEGAPASLAKPALP